MNTISHRLTKQYAQSFYLASHFLPKEKREAAYTIYAFCRLSDSIVDHAGKYPQIELDEWRRETRVAFQDGKSDHPILDAFVKTCQQYDISSSYAMELLDGMQMDLEKFRYETFDELYQYCYHVASTPGLMMVQVLECSDPLAKKYAADLGIAMQLTNILRDIKEDYQNGKVYIPREDLQKFGCIESNFGSGTKSEGFDQLMDFEISRAQSFYEESKKGVLLLSPDARLGVTLCRELYARILAEIRKEKQGVLKKRVVVPNLKKYILVTKYCLQSWLGVSNEIASSPVAHRR